MAHAVGMVLETRGERGADAHRALARSLPAAELGSPDESGAFDVRVEAASFDEALQRVWDAVASAGVDDHVRFREHPDIPEHFRTRRA